MKQWICLLMLATVFGLVGCKPPGKPETYGLPSIQDRREIFVALQPGETFYLPGGQTVTEFDAAYFEEASASPSAFGTPSGGSKSGLVAKKVGITTVKTSNLVFQVNIFDMKDTGSGFLLSDIYLKSGRFDEKPFFIRGTVEPDETKNRRLQYFGKPEFKENWLLSDLNSLVWMTNVKMPAFSQISILALARTPKTKDGPVIVYQEVRVVEPGEKVTLKGGQYLLIKLPEEKLEGATGVKVDTGTGFVVTEAMNVGNGIVVIRAEKSGKIKLDIEVLKKDAILPLPAVNITVAPSLVYVD